jgi:hypothetical protein
MADGSLCKKSNGSGGLEGLSALTMNQGFEFSTHCFQLPDVDMKSNVSGGSVNNGNGRTGTQGLHPGQWRFRLDNSATARAVVELTESSVTYPFLLGGGTWIFETLVNFETLSTAANEYVATFGLIDGRNNDAISEGVYFEYDRTNSVNFIGVTESGGTRTEVDSSVAVAVADTDWFTLRFEINADASSVEFFVDGTSIGTSTTNITSSDLQLLIRGLKSASTQNTNAFYTDYIYLRNELTTEV